MATGKKSPTERSLEECRARGWIPTVVERWKPGMRADRRTGKLKLHAQGVRVDAFGFGDILVLDDDSKMGSLMIQATSAAGVSTRQKKVLEDDPEVRAAVKRWLAKGNRFVIWGWYRRERPVKRRWWTYREVVVTLSHPYLIG